MNLAQHAWDAGACRSSGSCWSNIAPSRAKPTCAASSGIISTGCATRSFLTLEGTNSGSPMDQRGLQPDGKRLASGSGNGQNGQGAGTHRPARKLCCLKGHTGGVISVALARTANVWSLAVPAPWDDTKQALGLWRGESLGCAVGQELLSLKGRRAKLAFSQTGKPCSCGTG